MKKAAWWRASLVWTAAAPLGLFGGCYDETLRADRGALAESEEIERQIAALQLQTEAGWNVGHVDTALTLVDAVDVDVVGGSRWRSEMPQLVSRLRPWRNDLLPWNVPTLFQALVGAEGESLRAQMKPVHWHALDEDSGRGLALRSLFEACGWPRDTAVIIDAAGPRSVAVAAALADRFDPVFTFGNWPHPVGVVRAQQTLGAAMYYSPLFDRGMAIRPHDAPPMWILDADRLHEYVDEDTQFDNRYTVHLPDAAALRAMGIAHVLYVNAGGIELDDLNQPFVSLNQAGIELRVISLTEFERGELPPVAEGEAIGDGEEVIEPWVVQLSLGAGMFWWGGDLGVHAHFWENCWYPAPHWVSGPPGVHRRWAVTVGPPGHLGMRHLPTGVYRPAARGTLFNGSRPGPGASIGRVHIWSARTDGHFLGMQGSHSVGSLAGHGASHFGGHSSSYGGNSGSYSGHHGSSSSSSFGGRSGSFGRMGSGGMSG